MHTGQTDILIEYTGVDRLKRPEKKPDRNHGMSAGDIEQSGMGLRWLVMQSLKHKKWVLAVIRGDFSEYHVTDLMSENVELIMQYADYLNKGMAGSLIDQRRKKLLESIRTQYSHGSDGE